jgi:hypothetical protein
VPEIAMAGQGRRGSLSIDDDDDDDEEKEVDQYDWLDSTT